MRTLAVVALWIGVAWIHPARGDVHVSPAGSDASPGTRSRPFATPERARDAVRELRRTGGLGQGPFTIWLHGGDYLREETLELGRDDSGTPSGPICWQAWRGERVRFLGGRKVTRFEPVTDPSILSRLPPAARDHVVQADLAAAGIRNLGHLSPRGFSRPITPAHAELFFDHRPMTLARWPNHGEFTTIAGLPAGSPGLDEHGGELGDLKRGFLYAGDHPSRWTSTQDIWVHGYWAWDWANSYEQVASLDASRHLVTTLAPHGLYGFRKGQRFYFLNVLEELDEPGEWWIDTRSARLYFWPPEGTVFLDHSEAIVSVLETPLIRLRDAAHIELRGLEFEATRGSAIEIERGTGNRVDDCRLRNLGNIGVDLLEGSRNTVSGCELWDCGDSGVRMSGGNRQTLEPGGHVCEDCDFRRQGRWSKCYVPAIQIAGVGQRASHNRIQEHPHCAILFWGNDHLIEFNDVHHVALETGDVGAIYAGRDYTFRGNRIRSNFIHETGGVGMGSVGVYMDDCLSGTEISGNLFWKAHWAILIGGGRDHQVLDNWFIDCDPAVRLDGRGLDATPVWRSMVDETMRARLADVPAELYRRRYPAMRALDAYYGPPGGPAITGGAFQGVPPGGLILSSNVVVGKWIEQGWHATSAALEERGTLSLPSLPFRNLAAADFRPGPGWPLTRLGYPTIRVDQIGPRARRTRIAYPSNDSRSLK
jgi:hypothetical protein